MAFLGSERGRILGALAGYVAVLAVFYREEFVGRLLAGATAWLAEATAAWLEVFGFSAVTDGKLLTLAGTTFDVSYRCSGFLPITCLAVCILASHGRPAAKLIGIAAGAVFLLALNQVRILHLIVIHTEHRAWFDLAHDVLWGAAPVLAVLAIFALWRHWSWRLKSVAKHPNYSERVAQPATEA